MTIECAQHILADTLYFERFLNNLNYQMLRLFIAP